MNDPSVALRKAIVAALNPTPTTSRISSYLGCGVYDEVPSNAAFPYVSLDACQTIAERRLEVVSFSTCHFTLSVWSDAEGKIEAQQIAAKVRDALDTQINVTGFVCYSGKLDSSHARAGDAEARTTQVSMVFTYLLMPQAA